MHRPFLESNDIQLIQTYAYCTITDIDCKLKVYQ